MCKCLLFPSLVFKSIVRLLEPASEHVTCIVLLKAGILGVKEKIISKSHAVQILKLLPKKKKKKLTEAV